MGSASPMRVGAAPVAARTAPAEAAPAEARDFLSLLAPAATSAGPDVEKAPECDSGEESTDWLGDGLAQLLPGLFPAPAATAGEGGEPESSEDAGTLLTGGGDGLLPEAVAQVLETDAMLEAALEQFAAEMAAGDGAPADAAQDMLLQLDPLLAGDGLQPLPGGRLPAGAELPGLMLQTSAGSSAVTVTPAASANPLEHALRSTVGSPRWADELGTRLVVMSARGQQEGSLTLAPEHLGPLEVRISLSQNTANVWFGAQHADTRAALAEAMPRLRELFGEAGLSLGHAGVSEEAPRRQAADPAVPSGLRGESAAAPAQPVQVAVRQISSALLDLYA